MRRFLAVLAILAGSCTQTLLAADKSVPTDDRLVDQVKMKLAVDPDVKGGALDVSVKDAVVTIKGRVDSDKAKTRATHLAKKVKGVKDVDNELVVGPPTS
jgi:osmotically-inducible protein OsmY